VLKYAELEDPALERDYRLHAMDQEVRSLRRNLIVLMLLYTGPVAFDFFLFTYSKIFTELLPLRLAAYLLMIGAVVLPRRESTIGLRSALIQGVLIIMCIVTMIVGVGIVSPTAAYSVSFFLVILVLTKYLFLPGRWIQDVVISSSVSAAYLLGVMPAAGSPLWQISTSGLLLVVANVIGAMTAYQIGSLRRLEFVRLRQIEEERRLLEQANEELRRTEGVIADQRDQLASRVQELQEAQERLLMTQASLIQAEKLASLGQLVAGVAHELNTPMGIAVTAASHLSDRAGELREALAAGRMTRSLLSEGLETIDESARLVTGNIGRAADLVQGFKRVAIDQASEERRRFDLGEYVEEVLQSLAPRLRRLPHRLEVDCPRGLGMDSFPGAVSQVLTNLVLNATVHAFPRDTGGSIRIAAREAGDGLVELVVADDGRGIPAEIQGRVFDPFFTTNRADGGSGLGLHIVFNLVTQTLQGSITLHSAPGEGTTFVVRIPRRPEDRTRVAPVAAAAPV